MFKNIGLTIVYDNNFYDKRLKVAWGFASYIKVGNLRILFDTGGNPDILINNFNNLGISLDKIQAIILSHIHKDHTGGLFGVLERNNRVNVYVPTSFPYNFKSRIKEFDCKLVEIKNPSNILHDANIFSTGELGSVIKEQALLINSIKGLIVITGCAHPGIINIIKKAKELINKSIYLLIGGFHLKSLPIEQIKVMIKQFKILNVLKIAPCHCTGSLAMHAFKYFFGNDYIEVGVGKTINLNL